MSDVMTEKPIEQEVAVYESSDRALDGRNGRPAAKPANRKTILVRPWPALLTIDVAADYCGVSRTTIKEWHEKGHLRAHPLPGIRGHKYLDKVVFQRSELDRFLGLRPE